MKVLGIYFGQCSGSAFFVDGRIVFASSEERYSRKKSDEAYPFHSINAGLKYCKIKPEELDKVVIAGIALPWISVLLRMYSNFSVQDQLLAMEKYWRPKLAKKTHQSLLELFESKISPDNHPFKNVISNFDSNEIKQDDYSEKDAEKISNYYKKAISSHLKIDESKMVHIDHHACHEAYALYGSPIRDDKTLVITADAHGDELSGTIAIFHKDKNKIERLKEYSDSDFQVARIYRYTTLYLRMLPDEHEYKVMGLAPYYNGSKIKEVESIFDSMQTLDGLDFKFNHNIINIHDYLEENLKQFRFDHIAAGLQSFTERMLTNWIENAVNKFKTKSVVYSGGISMNVKANMKICQIPNIEKFFVCGGGADQSLCMGSCYAFAESQGFTSIPLNDLYLGIRCDYTLEDLKNLPHEYKITEYQNPDQIVDRILDGKIIATCLGRAEMGPRALGNRSILADPRKKENIEKINRKIKNRDFWMPFAPVILDEYQHEIIHNPKKLECPHMTLVFDTKNGKETIPAAIHQYDGTARPFILKKETNPKIWEIVNKFYQETNIPVLVNTSFNLHGQPIVNSFSDAIHVFNNSGLDSLLLDNHIIDK